MSKFEESSPFWPIAPKFPRYYLALQVFSFSLGYSAILLVSFLEGAVGSLSRLGLFLTANLIFGTIAGTSSASIKKSVVVTFVSVLGALILTFGVLTLPAIVGAIDGSLLDVVVLGMSLQILYLLLTLPIGFLAVLLGSVLHDRLGLPED